MELAPMYAVIQTGGKQYRVEEGTYLKIENWSLAKVTLLNLIKY